MHKSGAPIPLTSNEDELCALVSSLDEPALVTRADLELPGPTIIGVSDGLCQLTGYGREELIGRNPRLFQGPLTSRRVLDELRRACSRGESFIGEGVNYRKDGSPYLLQWAISPVFDAGRITHFFALQRDITDLRDYAGHWLRSEAKAELSEVRTQELLAALHDAVEVLTATKRSFRSRQLGELKERLIRASRPWSRRIDRSPSGTSGPDNSAKV